jgi:hypothetical protein
MLNTGKKSVLLLLASLVIISLFSVLAFAAEDEGINLVELFEVFEGFDIAEAYGKFPYIADSIIYFIFFISLAMATLGKRFEGSGGKGVVIALGVGFSTAMAFWAKQTGFTIGSLGPLAGLIFAITIGMWIFRILKGDQTAGSYVWMGIIFTYVAFMMFFPALVTEIRENKWGSMVFNLATILFVIALPMAFMKFFKSDQQTSGTWKGLISGRGGGGTGGGGDGPGDGDGPAGGLDPEQQHQEEQVLEQERHVVERDEAYQHQVDQLERMMTDLERDERNIEQKEGQELNNEKAHLEEIQRWVQQLAAIRQQIDLVRGGSR